jgi:hypothetical protein
MNNSKLSNTGMLKIASKWLQLLRAGKLSRPSINRVMGRYGVMLRPSAAPQDLTNLFPVSNIRSTSPLLHKMRDILARSTIKDTPAQKLYSDITKQYYSAINPAKSKDLMLSDPVAAYRSLPLHSEIDAGILPEVIKLMKSQAHAPGSRPAKMLNSLDALSPSVYKKDTHKLWGKKFDEIPHGGEYNPLVRGVLTPKIPYAGFPSTARHEFAHGFHYTEPKTFEKDVVGRTYQLLKRHPYTQSAAKGLPNFTAESAAQWIASGGNSRNAQKYIKDHINTADKQLPYKFRANAPYSQSQLEGFRRLSDASLKMDPSGRDAATLLHMSKNYNMPVPLRYTKPELFNPNPYLP